MVVKIRLSREGGRHDPHYLIVAKRLRSPRDGAYLEKVGEYHPQITKEENQIKVNLEAFQKWMAQGAQCSERALQVIKRYLKKIKADSDLKKDKLS